MKINGEVAGPNVEYIVLPRPEKDVVIIAKAIDDVTLFEKMCPPPKPRTKVLPNKQEIPNFEDPLYKKALNSWAEKKTAWYVIKSITEGTPELAWEKVDLSNHTTWKLYEEELREFGLSDMEIKLVVHGALTANGLSEAALDQARKRFLASRREQQEKSSCLKDDSTTTPSSEPVSDSE